MLDGLGLCAIHIGSDPYKLTTKVARKIHLVRSLPCSKKELRWNFLLFGEDYESYRGRKREEDRHWQLQFATIQLLTLKIGIGSPNNNYVTVNMFIYYANANVVAQFNNTYVQGSIAHHPSFDAPIYRPICSEVANFFFL